ncbi:capsular biosynthesis protein [Sphingomonas sabuli]|uniref:Capsular biosynthesis protein n=1 Tax=Sphingomonas sabuli TaxID=2764186 RepID=A0A7G9L5B3_9SPHN|nr:capsular biosynthesis protein [Sphingomonas sabuli]QNM83812.1 capsular biosynthesis protein [Sphingomonas sabuli]
MKTGAKRTFLFLQGPPGPLFRRLGAAMTVRGVTVHRINICGGDVRDWRDPSATFRGRFSEWPAFVDRFLCEKDVTDLVVFGDCRPYHASALGLAELRGVRTHVLEEGYLRPDWMTLEPQAVNARSTLPRDSKWFLEEAKRLPAEPDLPSITASFRRRARDSYFHYQAVVAGRVFGAFPHYRSHRPGSIPLEGLGWLWKFATDKLRLKKTGEVLERIKGASYFMFPLQLSTDYQIRTHSLFPDMQSAATYVIESFAANAPSDVHLVLKTHPLDSSFFDWHLFVRRIKAKLGLEGRVHIIDGGNLDHLARDARGLVCVNSTSATVALQQGTAVCTVGEAIYDMPGLTHQEHLDSFWRNPTAPKPGVYEAFRRVLVDRCLVRGGLASESAVEALVMSILRRLDVREPQPVTQTNVQPTAKPGVTIPAKQVPSGRPRRLSVLHRSRKNPRRRHG